MVHHELHFQPLYQSRRLFHLPKKKQPKFCKVGWRMKNKSISRIKKETSFCFDATKTQKKQPVCFKNKTKTTSDSFFFFVQMSDICWGKVRNKQLKQSK